MCLRRLLGLACVLFWAAGAGAVTLSYGNLLQVQHIEVKDNRLQMPLSRKKYANVRVLDKGLYGFSLACNNLCRFDAKARAFSIFSLWAAKTRPGMWIADVEINAQLSITFLIFKDKETYHLKPPEEVVFNDKKLLAQIRAALVEEIEAVQ